MRALFALLKITLILEVFAVLNFWKKWRNVIIWHLWSRHPQNRVTDQEGLSYQLFCLPDYTFSNWSRVNSCLVIAMVVTPLLPYKYRLWFMTQMTVVFCSLFHNRDSQQVCKPTEKTKHAVDCKRQCWEHHTTKVNTWSQSIYLGCYWLNTDRRSKAAGEKSCRGAC